MSDKRKSIYWRVIGNRTWVRGQAVYLDSGLVEIHSVDGFQYRPDIFSQDEIEIKERK